MKEGTVFAILIFGEALKPYLPKVVPSQFIDMIPYVLTILVLASAIGRATVPPHRRQLVCPTSRSSRAGIED